jgi:hypothetical protein
MGNTNQEVLKHPDNRQEVLKPPENPDNTDNTSFFSGMSVFFENMAHHQNQLNVHLVAQHTQMTKDIRKPLGSLKGQTQPSRV